MTLKRKTKQSKAGTAVNKSLIFSRIFYLCKTWSRIRIRIWIGIKMENTATNMTKVFQRVRKKKIFPRLVKTHYL
jgi:hypothetical protein